MTMVNSGFKGLKSENFKETWALHFTYVLIQIKCTNVKIFYPLEVVVRGSETQLQVGKN